jgi:hypothetical protein
MIPMALSPKIAKILPHKLRVFCEGLRYPHTFLGSLLGFILAMVFLRLIPYPQEVLIALGIVLFSTSKLR